MNTTTKVHRLQRRHARVRKKVVGTPERPRLAVYRSNRHVYAQVIDDLAARTLVAASTLKDADGANPTEQAKAVGAAIAKRALAAGITKVVFDRGGFKYHGQVQAVADGAREAGLEL